MIYVTCATDNQRRLFVRPETHRDEPLGYQLCGYVIIDGKQVDGYAILKLNNSSDTLPHYEFHVVEKGAKT